MTTQRLRARVTSGPHLVGFHNGTDFTVLLGRHDTPNGTVILP